MRSGDEEETRTNHRKIKQPLHDDVVADRTQLVLLAQQASIKVY
jgi:hypothetical protein